MLPDDGPKGPKHVGVIKGNIWEWSQFISSFVSETKPVGLFRGNIKSWYLVRFFEKGIEISQGPCR